MRARLMSPLLLPVAASAFLSAAAPLSGRFARRVAARAAAPLNRALVFVKPSANTAAARALVEAALETAQVEVLATSELSAEAIDAGGVIDKHYYSIASKATLGTADTLPVDEAAFEAFFDTTYAAAKATGRVFNALEACDVLGCDGAALEAHWEAAAGRGLRCKLGGGFYCCRLDADVTGAAEPCYVFNGFFMKMRGEYTKPGTSVALYSVAWDPAALPWADFRAKVVGATVPSTADPASIRGAIFADWQKLGLPAEPYAGDNGIHASAGPFEALVERANWLGADVAADPFGEALLGLDGVDAARVDAWSVDPRVSIGGEDVSLFDALEDVDAAACLDTCAGLVQQ